MKHSIFNTMAALALFLTAGCASSFLEEEPVGALNEQQLMNEEGIDAVLTAAYSSFNNMVQAHWMGAASLANYVFGDVAGADANKGTWASDQNDFTQIETYSFSSSNSYVAGKWAAVYEAVRRANNVLDLVDRVPAGTLANPALVNAQAKFIKAVWMFEGIRMFGAYIPYVTLADYRAHTDPQVSNHTPGSTVADIFVWELVEKDLKDAIASLPQTWESSADHGRATSWMAKAVLAKLYLYWSSPYNGTNGTADHWADARALLDDIIDNGCDARGQKYCLHTSYAELFEAGKSDWTGESVFDLQQTISGTQFDTNTIDFEQAIGQPGASGLGGWGFYQPTYEFVNSFIVDDDGLPDPRYTDKERISYITSGETPLPVCDLTIATDPRVDVCAGRFGVPFLDYGVPFSLDGWVRDYTNGGLYMNKKNLPKRSDRGSLSVPTAVASSAKNYHVIRFADILLMRAEVAIHEGDLDRALNLINQVRARAASDVYRTQSFAAVYESSGVAQPEAYTFDDRVNGRTVASTVANYRLGLYTAFANAEEATNALRREMRAEFGMEGHRWFDLARWGIVAEVLNNFRAYENQYLPKYKAVYSADWVTFPIPLAEISLSDGRFVQGPNWK